MSTSTPAPSQGQDPEAAPAVAGKGRRKRRHSASLTLPEFAARYRMGEDKAKRLIRQGLVRAVNIGSTRSGRPRYVITPEAMEEFERARAAAEPKPAPRRK